MSHLCLFFFNDTATTEIYTYGHTLSLHDALPIWFGRFTHCTAMRKGAERRASWSSDIDSRWSRRAGPRYQGVASERAVILSPLRPETGKAANWSMPICSAKAR